MNFKHSFTLLALLGIAGKAAAQVPHAGSYRDIARVTEIKVLTEHINLPRQLCTPVQVQVQAAPQARHGLGGAVIGGVAGGLIGHGVGEGSGKEAATAGAAVIGALVGDHLQNASAAPASVPTTTTVTQCRFVDNWVERQSGAIVSYSWQGHSLSESLPYVPAYHVGDEVPITVSTSLGAHA